LGQDRRLAEPAGATTQTNGVVWEASSIGSTFKLPTIRYALLTIGSLLLILATVLMLRQPGLPG
jgi:hypothetical protein